MTTIRSVKLSLKYEISSQLYVKIGIRKFKFVAKTPFHNPKILPRRKIFFANHGEGKNSKLSLQTSYLNPFVVEFFANPFYKKYRE